ncbi:hypothetical protein [Mucilaginibacter phyllosphaerae]
MQKIKKSKSLLKRLWYKRHKPDRLKMLHKTTGKAGEFVKEFSLNGTATTMIKSEDALLHFAPSEEFEAI